MAQKGEIRQRRQTNTGDSTQPSKNAVSASRHVKASASSSSSPNENNKPFLVALFQKSKPTLKTIFRITSPSVIGLFSASALTNDWYSVAYFFLTLAFMFIAIFLTFLNILKTHDNTMIEFEKIYKADGSTYKDEPMSTYEYDKLQAVYYATELPAFSIAAIWLYLWTNLKVSFLIYAGFIAFRFLKQPVFRIHLWGESASHDPYLQRPFGYKSTFNHDTNDVTLVHGLQQFEEAVNSASADSLVVVDASATWCGPCRVMAPIFEEMAKKYKKCTFLTFDIEFSQDIAKKLEITSIPTFVLFKNKEVVQQLTGPTPQVLHTAIETHM